MPASDSRAAVASPAKPPPMKAKVTWSVFGARVSDRRIGIVEVMREMARDLKILVVAVGAEPLVALLQIFLAQPLLVDQRGLQGGLQALRLVCHRHPKAPFEKSECMAVV